MNYTYEEKYKWLLSKLEIKDIDLWEGDALLGMKNTVYFQFSPIWNRKIDSAIELSMSQERKTNATIQNTN